MPYVPRTVAPQALKRALDGLGLAFPASIVGMLSGFGVLCAIRAWRAETADALESFFAPACRLFRAWLAAIFAPGLISLSLVMPSLPVPATWLGSGLGFGDPNPGPNSCSGPTKQVVSPSPNPNTNKARELVTFMLLIGGGYVCSLATGACSNPALTPTLP